MIAQLNVLSNYVRAIHSAFSNPVHFRATTGIGHQRRFARIRRSTHCYCHASRTRFMHVYLLDCEHGRTVCRLDGVRLWCQV